MEQKGELVYGREVGLEEKESHFRLKSLGASISKAGPFIHSVPTMCQMMFQVLEQVDKTDKIQAVRPHPRGRRPTISK